MAVVAVVSGGGSPGATTSTVALAACWPAQVVVADCDPRGGDIAAGLCGRQLLAGRLHVHAGLASGGVGSELLDASDSPSVAGSAGRDVVVDCGPLGPFTPWLVLDTADLVLVAAGPGLPRVVPVCEAVAELAGRIPARRLGLLACGTDPVDTARLIEASDVFPAAELPHDHVGAAMLWGQARWRWRRFDATRLGRAAQRAARRLHRRLHTTWPASGAQGSYPAGLA